MNDPDVMPPDEAAETLGVSREASAPQVERAYSEKLEALEKKIAQAPTAALKNKYRVAMDRLKVAREVLEKQDDGCDLPALEISEAPAPAPVSAPAAIAPAAPTPAAAEVAASPPHPKKPLPLKAIGIGIAALLLIALTIILLRDPATAIYAGDYRNRIEFDKTVYDYSVSVTKKGEITGINQLADKSSKPVKITGKVDEKGVITATADDKSRFVGQIKGDKMELKEQIGDSEPVSVTLTKGLELPKQPPQAELAGIYHNPSITYAILGKYEMRGEVAANGDLSISKRDLTDKEGYGAKGRVNTKGKFTASTLGDSEPITYSGSIANDEMIVVETFPDGDVFNFKLTKGEKETVFLSPYTGVYRNRINYSSVVYDFDITVDENGVITGSNQVADDSLVAVTITGSVNDKGEFTALASDKTSYSGTIKDGEMAVNEKVNDKILNFKLSKDQELPTESPQAALAGTYTFVSATGDTTFVINDKGNFGGAKANIKGEVWLIIKGQIDTKGKLTAEGTEQSSGRVFIYEGTVTESEIKVTEQADGKTYNFTAPKS